VVTFAPEPGASVLRDIVEPSATIHPDGVGYTVTLKDGTLPHRHPRRGGR
jgi:hypothetical protein